MLFIMSLTLDTAGGIGFQITHAMLTCKQSTCCADSSVQADCTLKKYVTLEGGENLYSKHSVQGMTHLQHWKSQIGLEQIALQNFRWHAEISYYRLNAAASRLAGC